MEWLSTFASGGQDVRRCQPIFKIYWEKYQIKTSNLLWWHARACFDRYTTEKPNFFQKLLEKTMSDVQTTFAFLVIALVLIDQIGHAIYQIYKKEPRISIFYNFVVKYWWFKSFRPKCHMTMKLNFPPVFSQLSKEWE